MHIRTHGTITNEIAASKTRVNNQTLYFELRPSHANEPKQKHTTVCDPS